jgi:hypothetical protein
VRFFAHDGKAVHGPAPVEELLKLPGFDGDTLVCPVGSEDSADWKPALAYPPFKEALLSPAAKAAPAPAPASVPTRPCPRCSHENPLDSHYCNSCGDRVDGKADVRVPPAAVAAPPAAAAPVPPAPVPLQPEPVPFTPVQLPPETEPERPPVERRGGPRRPMMGRMGETEGAAPESAPPSFPGPAVYNPPPEAAPAAAPVAPPDEGLAAFAASVPVEPPLAPEPAPAAVAAAEAAAFRRTLISAFLGAVAAGGALGWWLLRPKAATAPQGQEINLAPPPQDREPIKTEEASRPVASPAAAPPATAAAPVLPMPPKASSPLPKPSLSRKTAARAPRKAHPKRTARRKAPARTAARRAKRRASASSEEALIISHAVDAEPSTPAARADSLAQASPAAAPGGEPGAAAPASSAPKSILQPIPSEAPKSILQPIPSETPAPAARQPRGSPDDGFLLPGVPRRVTAPAKAPEKTEEPAEAAAPEAAAPPARMKADEGADDGSARQVKEQFDFCSQLLAQGAYADHFDTCLCADARNNAPYHGRRGYYAKVLADGAKSGHLETIARISSIKVNGSTAEVTARWKESAQDPGRELTQDWRLEDGLWCRSSPPATP